MGCVCQFLIKKLLTYCYRHVSIDDKYRGRGLAGIAQHYENSGHCQIIQYSTYDCYIVYVWVIVWDQNGYCLLCFNLQNKVILKGFERSSVNMSNCPVLAFTLPISCQICLEKVNILAWLWGRPKFLGAKLCLIIKSISLILFILLVFFIGSVFTFLSLPFFHPLQNYSN